MVKQQKSLYFDDENPYGMFLAAWPFKDKLNEFPEVHESAFIIASYIKALFYNQKLGFENSIIEIKKINLIIGLRKHIFPWLSSRSKNTVQVEIFFNRVLI